MWLGVVTDLVAHAWRQRESTAILQLGVQLPIKAQQNVAFATPMISEVARAVLDHSNPYRAEEACAPVRCSSLALVNSGLNRRPIGCAKWDICYIHDCLMLWGGLNRTRGPVPAIDTDLSLLPHTARSDGVGAEREVAGPNTYAMGHETALIVAYRSKLAFCRETEFIT